MNSIIAPSARETSRISGAYRDVRKLQAGKHACTHGDGWYLFSGSNSHFGFCKFRLDGAHFSRPTVSPSSGIRHEKRSFEVQEHAKQLRRLFERGIQ